MIIEPNYSEMCEQRQNIPSRLIKHLRPRGALYDYQPAAHRKLFYKIYLEATLGRHN